MVLPAVDHHAVICTHKRPPIPSAKHQSDGRPNMTRCNFPRFSLFPFIAVCPGPGVILSNSPPQIKLDAFSFRLSLPNLVSSLDHLLVCLPLMTFGLTLDNLAMSCLRPGPCPLPLQSVVESCVGSMQTPTSFLVPNSYGNTANRIIQRGPRMLFNPIAVHLFMILAHFRRQRSHRIFMCMHDHRPRAWIASAVPLGS